MDFKIARQMIGVIRTERQGRSDRVKNEDQDFASDQWSFTDEPFINDMCLLVIVALRHQVERELVFLAACACAKVGPTITRKQYQQEVVSLREEIRNKDGWKNVIATLNLESFVEWETAMKTLQLLANCLKHEPTQEPDKKLLNHLNLPLKPQGPLIVSYMPLPESGCFREGLAESVNLPKDADYCTIAETFVDLANQFLESVRQKTILAQITGPVSLVEFGA
jgi:hypothetical protein